MAVESETVVVEGLSKDVVEPVAVDEPVVVAKGDSEAPLDPMNVDTENSDDILEEENEKKEESDVEVSGEKVYSSFLISCSVLISY
jgi:hypothetical protein